MTIRAETISKPAKVVVCRKGLAVELHYVEWIQKKKKTAYTENADNQAVNESIKKLSYKILVGSFVIKVFQKSTKWALNFLYCCFFETTGYSPSPD